MLTNNYFECLGLLQDADAAAPWRCGYAATPEDARRVREWALAHERLEWESMLARGQLEMLEGT